ncbi:MAG: efflux RND transporter periplasmic adaptor subunit [Alphaproteobacteria bacterium]
MKRAALTGLALAAVTAAGVGGYWAGLRGAALPGVYKLLSAAPARAAAGPTASGPVVYYRDPDGRPVYSSAPRRTADGREFRAVGASEEDVDLEDKPSLAAIGSATAAPRRVLYYRNPMGLPDVSPVPKKDSMGMDYIPVYEGEDDDGSVVKVSLGKLQRTGVRSEPVDLRAIVRPVRVPGTIQFDERRVAVVATRSDAFVEEVANVTTGDRVTKGQALVRLYSPEISGAGAQFLTDLNVGARDGPVGGARQRLENLGVPPEVISEIERTRRVPLSITWRAPRDGVVLERNIVDGMKIAPGEVLFRLADISTVWVLADVPEYELESIRPGAAARIRVRSLPGRSFEGRVALIYPQVAKETRTTRVRIEIPNPDGVLLDKMYADVEIETGSGAPVLSVSESALIDTGTRQFVILDRGEGRFEPRGVQIGMRGEGVVEIREGVAEGDRVVVSANFLIDAESNLKAALRGLAGTETPR